jgi:hypothetical protein
LKSVFGIVVGKRPAAHTPDHRPMAANNGLDGQRIALPNECVQQVGIGAIVVTARGQPE